VERLHRGAADINGPGWDEQRGPEGPNVDFCMAIGDSRTQEAVFKLLNRGQNVVTATVGRKVRTASALDRRPRAGNAGAESAGPCDARPGLRVQKTDARAYVETVEDVQVMLRQLPDMPGLNNGAAAHVEPRPRAESFS